MGIWLVEGDENHHLCHSGESRNPALSSISQIPQYQVLGRLIKPGMMSGGVKQGLSFICIDISNSIIYDAHALENAGVHSSSQFTQTS
jgi:hypothetical protein